MTSRSEIQRGAAEPSSAPGLRISSPADRLEREADRVARQVLAMPGPASAGTPIGSADTQVQRACECTDDIQRQVEEEEEEDVQLSPDGRASGTVTAGDVRGMGTGSPLPGRTRSFFEPRFGNDLSGVRVHTSARAGQLARRLGARAFTHRQDVGFAPGQFRPDSHSGRHLLAHELTHTIQQYGGPDVISRAVVYGSGYARPAEYRPDEREITHIEAHTWYPHTLDFRAAAGGSGGGSGQNSFAGFLTFLQGQSAGSIDRLGIIGHASSQGLGLAGTVGPSGVQMPVEGAVYQPNLTDNAAAVAAVRDRFAAGAYITLFGCNAGVNQGLLDALSTAFGVRVNGFSNPLYFCMSWSGSSPRRSLGARGRLDYLPPVVIDPNDPLPPEQRAICSQSVTDVWNLAPDRSSTVGVPTQQGAATP